MSGLAYIGAILMLLFGGLAAGVMWGITVDRLLVWNHMSITEYATDFRRLLKNVDPMMPIFVSLSAAGAGIFAIETSGAASVLGWSVLGCDAAIMVVSATVAEPVNSKFRRLPEGTPPDRAGHYRVFWRRFHSVRTLVSVSAFALALASVLTT